MLKRLPLLLSALIVCARAFGAPVIDYGSDWKYFLGTSEASDPDTTAWRLTEFDDSSWLSGPTPTGYANPANSPSEANIVTFTPSVQEAGNLSVFFRKKFSVLKPSSVGQLTLNVNIDDGFVAWINGVEIGRYNFPDGMEPLFNSNASSAIEPTLVSLPVTIDLSSVLDAGDNTIAVEVYNANTGSSDLFFDAALESDLDETAPTVADTSPAPGSVINQLQSIEILFSENVQGVDAADLLINGVPAVNVTAASPRDYVFNFPAAADGTVTVAWSAKHGIADVSPAQNPFAGGSWTYRVDSAGPAPILTVSEFMADNEHGIKDDDGQHSDWIELYNSGADAVNLAGWYLTDTTNNLTKWRIPSFPLGANNYLIIWASAKNRTNPAAQFHTNFKLSKDPSYLALVDPRTNVVSEFAPYPTQRTDVSYGRDALDPSIKGYFNVPTPGARNSTSGAGFGVEPIFSLAPGIYTNASLTVSITAPVGQIRYTLDGSAPAATSTLYTNSITLTTSTTIKARVFQTGLFPSELIANAYIIVDSTVASFNSKLPVMIISTTGKGILDHPPAGTTRTFASIAAVDTFRGRSSPLGTPDYLGQGGISIRGQTSSGFPKRPYRLELQDGYGNDRDSDWFGLPDGSDWILNNPYTDKPFLQNFLAYELFEKMGHYSVRRRFVEVFVNTSGGKVTYPRDYVGVYILLEKIKVDKNRVPIAKLTPYDTTEPNISGGYMFKKDKSSAGDLDFYTNGGDGFSGQDLKIHEPNPRDITGEQLSWLNDYINRFEEALYAPDWLTRTGTDHYSAFIDVDSFVDQHWIVEFAKQIDGYRLSNYLSKDRNGKIKMEPIWDYNLSFGNADYNDGFNSSGWYWKVLGENDHLWLRRLICGTPDVNGTTGDPDFNQRIADRWSQLRTNVLNSTNVLARVDALAALLTEAAARDFQKWPRLGTYIWPNPSFYVTPTTYAGIISAMKTWIKGRYNWIDSQFVIPPKPSIPAGRIPPGISVGITGVGTIYYTLDGTDPRLPGGATSRNAQTYSGPIPLTRTTRLVTRSHSGTKWSGSTVATYVLDTPALTISEIMYHPVASAPPSPYLDGDFEYLEFKNTGSTAIALAGFTITDGVTFTFPTYSLAAGARALVVKNRAAFESRYGTALPALGEFIGQLDNSGEHLTVLGAMGETILDFTYNDAWQKISDGAGFALVLTDESVSSGKLNDAASWRAGSVFNGTPGQPESASTPFPKVVISEALTRPQGSEPSMVELQNLSSTPADVGGWFITDDFNDPIKFRIPAPTLIPAGGFVVFTGDDFRNINTIQPFLFDPLGEEIYLFSGDAQTNLTGYVNGFKYGAQKTNDTFGRYVTSAGAELFVPQQSATLGASNAGPAIPPIVISEIMYHPPEVNANGALWNNSEDEYIELFNRSAAAVQLFDPAHPTNSWKLAGGATFVFPSSAALAAGEYALLVNFDPIVNTVQLAAFRQKYGVPASVQIFGPYGGNLNNGGETITLSAPDAPLAGGTIPYIALEEIAYQNSTPWPSGADGGGFALSRRDTAKFGNDPANWVASRPTPGAANATPLGPIILQHPASQSVAAAQTVRLNVAASGQNLRYQWRFNDQNILNATADSLVLTNVQPVQSGGYSVVVFSADASTASQTALLTVGGDFDRDGMDDNWELAHGLNPFDATDASADADNDGVSNLQEYIAGTEPRDPSSYLTVDKIEAGADTAVTFHAAAGRTYTIQYTDSLSPANWQKLTDVFGGSAGATARITDQPTTTRYYRLLTPAQP
jgi:hypothetical protein